MISAGSNVADRVVHNRVPLPRLVQEDQLALQRLVLRPRDRLVVVQVGVAVGDLGAGRGAGRSGLSLRAGQDQAGPRGEEHAVDGGGLGLDHGGGPELGLGGGLEELEGDGGNRGAGDTGLGLGGRGPERPALGLAGSSNCGGHHNV